jgi:hypothetical protein
VVALNQWVDTQAAVRARPYFAPLDGSADASILILLEAPARLGVAAVRAGVAMLGEVLDLVYQAGIEVAAPPRTGM